MFSHGYENRNVSDPDCGYWMGASMDFHITRTYFWAFVSFGHWNQHPILFDFTSRILNIHTKRIGDKSFAHVSHRGSPSLISLKTFTHHRCVKSLHSMLEFLRLCKFADAHCIAWPERTCAFSLILCWFRVHCMCSCARIAAVF